MNSQLMRARLFVMGAAALVLLGGIIFAVTRWNEAENDRAFVDAAARAARLPDSAAASPRYFAPAPGAQPTSPSVVARIEATERTRTMPAAPAAPAQRQDPAGKPPPAAR